MYYHYRISSSNERKKKVGRNIRSRDTYGGGWKREGERERERRRERRHAERKPMVLDDEARYHSGRGRGTAYGHTAAPLQLALSWPHHLRLRHTREGGRSSTIPPAIISRDRRATGDWWPERKKTRVYIYIYILYILYVGIISSEWKKWTHDGIHDDAWSRCACEYEWSANIGRPIMRGRFSLPYRILAVQTTRPAVPYGVTSNRGVMEERLEIGAKTPAGPDLCVHLYICMCVCVR